MQDIGLIIVIGAAISLICFILNGLQSDKTRRKKKKTALYRIEVSDANDDLLSTGSEDNLNDGKTDERIFEIGDSEIDRSIIDIERREYYQNLGDNKLRQDEMAEMLLKESQENSKKKLNFENLKVEEQARRKQNDKNAQNQHWLNKIKGYRIKRKIAKKVAKKNIQLDEEQIKKIKIRALAGKMR